MLDNIFSALFTCVFFIGVITLLYLVLLYVIRPKKGEINYIVVVFNPDEINAVARISYLVTRLTMSGEKQFTKIVAIDNGMSDEQYSAVLSAFSAENCVLLCPRVSMESVFFAD